MVKINVRNLLPSHALSMVSYKLRYKQLTKYDRATKYKYNDRAQNAGKNAFNTVGKILCLLFILFQTLIPLDHTPSNIFGAKKMELLWQGACNKNTYSDS